MILVDGLVLAVHYLLGDSERIACAEWLGECHELVDYAAKCPDISFLCVWLRLHNLGTRVEDGPYERFHDACALCAPSLGEAEVG